MISCDFHTIVLNILTCFSTPLHKTGLTLPATGSLWGTSGPSDFFSYRHGTYEPEVKLTLIFKFLKHVWYGIPCNTNYGHGEVAHIDLVQHETDTCIVLYMYLATVTIYMH